MTDPSEWLGKLRRCFACCDDEQLPPASPRGTQAQEINEGGETCVEVVAKEGKVILKRRADHPPKPIESARDAKTVAGGQAPPQETSAKPSAGGAEVILKKRADRDAKTVAGGQAPPQETSAKPSAGGAEATTAARDAGAAQGVLPEMQEVPAAPKPADEAGRQFVLQNIRYFYAPRVRTILNSLRGFKPELLADREVMLAAVEKDGCFLEFAAEELRADHDFVLKALKKHPFALHEAAESLRADRSFLLKAVKATKAWWLVHFAAPAIEKDANFVQRCREAAGTGLVFTYYHSSNCFFDMRQAFPAVGASVPGGTAYDEVMKQLREAIHGSTATVWFDEEPVFGHCADDGRWTHPSTDCGRDMVPVPPAEGRDAMWKSTVDARSKSHVPEVGEKYICWCCRWLREVRKHHAQGKVTCCATSNIYNSAWVEKYGAGSSELADADAEKHGLPKEIFKNGKPANWGEGKIRIFDGSSYDRRAPVHPRTAKPLGVGCRWERQALDNMDFPVYAFFTP